MCRLIPRHKRDWDYRTGCKLCGNTRTDTRKIGVRVLVDTEALDVLGCILLSSCTTITSFIVRDLISSHLKMQSLTVEASGDPEMITTQILTTTVLSTRYLSQNLGIDFPSFPCFLCVWWSIDRFSLQQPTHIQSTYSTSSTTTDIPNTNHTPSTQNPPAPIQRSYSRSQSPPPSNPPPSPSAPPKPSDPPH